MEVGGAVGVCGVGGAFGEGGDEGAEGVVGAGAVVGDEGAGGVVELVGDGVGAAGGEGAVAAGGAVVECGEDGVEEGPQVGGACGASGEGRGGHGWCGPSGARGRWCQLVRVAEGAAEEPNDLDPKGVLRFGVGVLGPAGAGISVSLFA